MKLRELFDLFHTYNQNNRARRTAEFYRDTLAKVIRAHGSLEAAELRPHHLLQWKSTWHLVLAVLRLFRWAEEHDLGVNPAIMKLRRPRLGRRKRVLSRLESHRLLRKAAPDFRRLLIAARETAARPQELRELCWEQLQFPEDGSVVSSLRTGRAVFALTSFKGQGRRGDAAGVRLLPISPRLGRMLLRLSDKLPETGIVFLTAGGAPWSYSAMRCRIRRLRVRAGLAGHVGGEQICCYTLRHSAATGWAARGLQTSVVQQFLGHSSVKTTQRYVHLHRKEIMKAWEEFCRKRKE